MLHVVEVGAAQVVVLPSHGGARRQLGSTMPTKVLPRRSGWQLGWPLSTSRSFGASRRIVQECVAQRCRYWRRSEDVRLSGGCLGARREGKFETESGPYPESVGFRVVHLFSSWSWAMVVALRYRCQAIQPQW